MKKNCLSSKAAGLVLLLNAAIAFSYIISDPQGDVTVDFRLINGSPVYLQINADVLPGQTIVVDTANFGPDTADKRFIHLSMHVGFDPIANAKGIVQERTIVSLSPSDTIWVYWPSSAYQYRNTRILIKRNDGCDTIGQIPIDGEYFIFMPPAQTCKDADVSDQDSLLALLKQKYDSSVAVCVLDTLPATHETAEVGYDSISSSALCHWSSFNRHDDLQTYIFNFKLAQKLKGTFLKDTISFNSGFPGRSTYFFRSSKNDSPIYHQDSIKTCGVNTSLWVPDNAVNPHVDYRYGQWLVFYSYSSANGYGNPGFPNGWSCPYLSRSSLHELDPVTLHEVVQPARIGSVVPILHDSIRFNDSSIVPLSAFLKSIGRAKVQSSMPVMHEMETAVRIRNGNFVFTADGSRNGAFFEVSIYSISGRMIFHRENIAPGAAICSTNRFAAGTYMVSVKAPGGTMLQKTTMVSIVK
jgi:hypothetical protein